MKRKYAPAVGLLLFLLLPGCALKDAADRYLGPAQVVDITKTPSQKERVYMDELSGTIRSFDGATLYLASEENTYAFSLAQASVEAKYGLLRGDEVSLIYEGQLDGSDTEDVTALKVTDQFPKKEELKEQTLKVTLDSMTTNTILVQDASQHKIRFFTTGVRQYYPDGIRENLELYIHYIGMLPESYEEDSEYMARNIRVLSVSAVDPFPASVTPPTPTPTPSPESTAQTQDTPSGSFKARLLAKSSGNLQIQPDDSEEPCALDCKSLPVYFPGGLCEGQLLDVYYTGNKTEGSTEGLTFTFLQGEDPSAERENTMTFSFSGMIVGRTADTAVLRTEDGADIFFRTTDLPDTSDEGPVYGSNVKVYYNPLENTHTNVLKCLRMENSY